MKILIQDIIAIVLDLFWTLIYVETVGWLLQERKHLLAQDLIVSVAYERWRLSGHLIVVYGVAHVSVIVLLFDN